MKQPVYKTVASRDIKYEFLELPELLKWIKDNVPKGTKDEDIRLEFEVDQETGYYDDVIVTAEMQLKVKQ